MNASFRWYANADDGRYTRAEKHERAAKIRRLLAPFPRPAPVLTGSDSDSDVEGGGGGGGGGKNKEDRTASNAMTPNAGVLPPGLSFFASRTTPRRDIPSMALPDKASSAAAVALAATAAHNHSQSHGLVAIREELFGWMN